IVRKSRNDTLAIRYDLRAAAAVHNGIGSAVEEPNLARPAIAVVFAVQFQRVGLPGPQVNDSAGKRLSEWAGDRRCFEPVVGHDVRREIAIRQPEGERITLPVK